MSQYLEVLQIVLILLGSGAVGTIIALFILVYVEESEGAVSSFLYRIL